MYAVIETGGKQYRVQEGDTFKVEKLDAQAGENVVFDKVLVMSSDAGIQVGTPYIEGAKVFARLVENGKNDKIIIFKYKAKKDYRKKQGHRQPYSMVEITGIGEAKPAKKEKPAAAPAAEEAPAEEAPKAAAPSIKSMKKDELIAFAAEKGIEIDPKATKPVIIEAIEAALK